MLATVVLWSSGLSSSACPVSWRSRPASRWLIAPAHHCSASATVRCSSVIIACKAAPARCSVAAMVASHFSEPVTLGPFTTTLRLHLECCQPGCLPHCLLAHNRFPHRQRLVLPYGISG
jgi:hypothetical protein